MRTLIAARTVQAARGRNRPATPAELAKRIIPNYVVTPTIRLISDVLAEAIEKPDRRVIITCPPRTGKSVLVSQVGPVWALSRDPDTLVIVKSYADELAEEHSREARRFISENSDLLGIELAADKASMGRWRLEGHRGGMLAGGILTGTVGHGADLLICDDPIKNSVEADSATHRRRLLAEFKGSLLSRLHPSSSCIVVLTRWGERDIAGELLAEGGWDWINVPAVATRGVPDALGREPGVAMVSALGRTAKQFEEIKREVGSRHWAALYLGVPSSPEGGLIKQEWLEQWRLPAAPAHPVRRVVAVDPADSGERDAAGIVAASLTADGTVAVIADVSAPMTSDEWARAAVELAIGTGAGEIGVEAFSSGTTYVRVIREELARRNPGRFIKVSGWPPKGSPRRGNAEARAAMLLQALETGRCRIAGHLPGLEEAAVHWQAGGQHCPDQVSAMVIAHDLLAPIAGQRIEFAAPDLTARISDRPGIGAGRRFGQRDPATVTPIARRFSRRMDRAREYDPLAYLRW
jgi:hypothetical protein